MTKSKIDRHLEALLEVVVHVQDPADRLRKLRDLEEGTGKLVEEARSLKRATILELRSQDPRPTWDTIGELLGVSGQRAHELANK